jgi:hypothetical protein
MHAIPTPSNNTQALNAEKKIKKTRRESKGVQSLTGMKGWTPVDGSAVLLNFSILARRRSCENKAAMPSRKPVSIRCSSSPRRHHRFVAGTPRLFSSLWADDTPTRCCQCHVIR